jgi:uncharacterized membrane protein
MDHLFSCLCGQNPGHTWLPGGALLPFCQRCTGLFVGALVAFLLHLLLRPRLTNRFLVAHAGLILSMAPFGFHWVAHGPILRTLTGIWFAFGVVALLFALPGSRVPSGPGRAGRTYWLWLALACLWVPALAALGGPGSAFVLKCLGLGGALVLVGLTIANFLMIPVTLFHLYYRVSRPGAAHE